MMEIMLRIVLVQVLIALHDLVLTTLHDLVQRSAPT
jgi:hypothetical protein